MKYKAHRTISLSTFAPEPFEVVRPFSVVLIPDGDSVIASFSEADICMSGDSDFDAIEALKAMIISHFERWENAPDTTLGPRPRRQRDILLSVIRRTLPGPEGEG